MSTVAPPAITAAHVPEAAASPAGAARAVHCENCDAPVSGRFCATCGQRLEPPVHSLWHFVQVAAEDLTHADSRLWRTLAALLFKPGYLTREFLTGHRARYLPPVRLYLVISVVFFLWASATPVYGVRLERQDSGGLRASTAQLQEDEQSVFGASLPGESAEQYAERVCRGANYDGPWRRQLQPAAHRACLRIVADKGRSLQQAFLHNLPRAMFVFLPLLAAVMLLMYWRPRHYYVEHLLLLVHNHAFAFLVATLAGVVAALLPVAKAWLGAAVFCYLAWYAYRSLRVAYGQGRLLTMGKLALLSFFYLASGALMLALTTVYSALTL
jgi:Protein of unknown function (DUF3667)